MMVALALCLLAACAAQGPPQPPRVERPEQITDLAVTQVGRTLDLSFTPPELAADGERLSKPLEIEIFRTVAPAGQKPAPARSAAINPRSGSLTGFASHAVCFGVSSFGPGPFATAQRCGSRVPEGERRRHDETDE